MPPLAPHRQVLDHGRDRAVGRAFPVEHAGRHVIDLEADVPEAGLAQSPLRDRVIGQRRAEQAAAPGHALGFADKMVDQATEQTGLTMLRQHDALGDLAQPVEGRRPGHGEVADDAAGPVACDVGAKRAVAVRLYEIVRIVDRGRKVVVAVNGLEACGDGRRILGPKAVDDIVIATRSIHQTCLWHEEPPEA